jgi:hypothetical protein
MIRLLRTNTPLNYAVIVAVMILFWLFKFVFMPTSIENYETVALFSINPGQTLFLKYFSAFAAFTAFYLFSLLLVKFNSDLLIVENAYQSPGFFFVLLSGYFINSQQLNPLIFSGMLIFISIAILMYAQNQYIALSNAFNSGFIFSLAVLIYPKTIVFIPILIISSFMVKPVNWRELTVMIMGLLTPLILFFTISWLYGDFGAVYSKTINSITQIFPKIRYTKHNILVQTPLIFWTLILIFSVLTTSIPRKVSTRKFQTILNIFLLFTLLFFVTPFSPNEAVVVMYAPIAIFLSNIITNAGNRIRQITFWGLVASIIFSQIIQISFYMSVF